MRSFTGRWGAVLEHPATRTLIIIAEVAALAFAIWATVIAKQAFDEQSRSTAYQLVNAPTASPAAKIASAQYLLQVDGSVFKVDATCKRQRGCGTISGFKATGEIVESAFTGLVILAPEFSKLLLDSTDFANTIFSAGSWTEVGAVGGDWTNTNFGFMTLRNSNIRGGANLTRASFFISSMDAESRFEDVLFDDVELCAVQNLAGTPLPSCLKGMAAGSFIRAYVHEGHLPKNLPLLKSGLPGEWFVCPAGFEADMTTAVDLRYKACRSMTDQERVGKI